MILCVGVAVVIPIEHGIVEYIRVVSPDAKVAGTSVSAEVPVTPENTLAKQLKEKELELNEREQKLKAKDAYLSKNFTPTPGTIRTLYFSLIILAILLIINFIMDLKRYKKTV